MKEVYQRWYTPHLSRDFEMLSFGHAGLPVVLFPTSMGRYFQYKDFGLIDAVRGFVESGRVRFYCPDGIDSESWYNKGIHPGDRVRTHIGYENVIVRDVLARIEAETGVRRVALGGCSFGAYHAANLAFRYPDHVSYLFCMGGAFDIKQFLDGHYDDNCYFHNPVDYLPNLQDPWYLVRFRSMGIVLGTGEFDGCLEENRRLSAILGGLGVDHWFDCRPGGIHDWPAWKEMFPDYLARV